MKSMNIRFDCTEEIIGKLKDNLFEIIQVEKQNKNKKMKESEKTYMTYRMSVTQAVYIAWESQEEQSMRKQKKVRGWRSIELLYVIRVMFLLA